MRRTMLALVAGCFWGSTVAWAQPATPVDGSLRGRGSAPTVPSNPKTYGTTAVSYQFVAASQFTPSETGTTYSDVSFGSEAFGRYPTAGSGYFISSPTLPSGALVSQVDIKWCDSSPGSQNYFVDAVDLNGNSFQILAAGTNGAGSPGCGTTVQTLASPFTVDNASNQLVLLVHVGTYDGSSSFSGALVHYQLQVSPAPMTPTFNDVPASDFGFQYVEALVAAGITGGCGGGNYCPDSPVTRRQMAIFISKALGLQWP